MKRGLKAVPKALAGASDSVATIAPMRRIKRPDRERDSDFVKVIETPTAASSSRGSSYSDEEECLQVGRKDFLSPSLSTRLIPDEKDQATG